VLRRYSEPPCRMAVGIEPLGNPGLAVQAGGAAFAECSSLVQQVLHLSRYEEDPYGPNLGSR
jgi:hypothetical protein